MGDDQNASADGLEFIEIATGETVLAERVDEGWLLELADGTQTRVTNGDLEANYRIRAGGAS